MRPPGSNWIDPPKRERKRHGLAFVDDGPRKGFGAGKPDRPKSKMPLFQDYQFYNVRGLAWGSFGAKRGGGAEGWEGPAQRGTRADGSAQL